MRIDFEKENAFSEEIMHLRYSDQLKNAVTKCKEAIKEFPDNNFFYKILGDIYLQMEEYQLAADAYLDNLKRLKNADRFRTFIRFYRTFKKYAPEQLVIEYQLQIKYALDNHSFCDEVAESLISFFGNALIQDKEVLSLLSLSDHDKNLTHIREKTAQWETEKNATNIGLLVKHKLERDDFQDSPKINRYLIEFLEKTGRYDWAVALIEKTQKPYSNRAIRCTALRIGRRISNYDLADRIFTIDEGFIDDSDFNIQYELVYYFESKNDTNNLDKTLKTMQKSARNSIPIARTLYNFYLSFNKLDEAQSLYEKIKKLEENQKSNKLDTRREEQIESEQVVWQRIKDLVSEQEHNRQMVALRDLLKGFSHELGQPVTNIRYAVQLQQMKMKRGIYKQEDVAELLDGVLAQTTRIGRLLARFRPIVSSKSTEELFSVKDCAESVLQDLSARMEKQNISYTLGGPQDVVIFGDQVQFSQVFYNLILNSMQAIEKNGHIKVIVASDRKTKITITFSDNGPGIPIENHRKVFEPFFSTKDPTAGNGGEGLGLFIVWNILKMFNGTIHIDSQYASGAKFIIKLPLPKETK